MTSPKKSNGRTIEQLNAMCRSKNRYPDKLTACAAGAHFIDTMQIDALWYYRCPICRGWHLTRQNHGDQRNVMTILKS